MEFKIGDRVIVTEQKTVSNYENTLNCVGTIDYIYPKNNTYGLILDNKNNPNSNRGRFYFSSDEIRRIPTFTEIKEAKMDCVILTNTQKEANLLDGILDNSFGNERPCELWAYYEVQTVYYIRNGKISSYGNSEDIGNGSWLVLNFKDVYISEFGDAIAKGVVFGKFVVDGKVSSLNSYLTPDSEYYQYDSSSYHNEWLADIDGSYGENDNGIFFFTVDGKYIEWTGEYLYSDMPFEVENPVLTIKEDK